MAGAAFLLGGIIGFIAAFITAVFTSANWQAVFIIYCVTSLAITVAWIATQLMAPKTSTEGEETKVKAWSISEDGKARANG